MKNKATFSSEMPHGGNKMVAHIMSSQGEGD